jgi:hypothetical protein
MIQNATNRRTDSRFGAEYQRACSLQEYFSLMSLAINARVAGVTLLVYIAAGVTSLLLSQMAGAGGDTAATLAAMVEHAGLFRIIFLLDLLCCFSASTLAVTLYALTSAQGTHVAMLAMVCRLVEGVLIAASLSDNLGALWLARQSIADRGAVHLLAAYVMRNEVALTSTFFAVGSLLFACLLVRGRLIPAPLAWLGVVASLILVVVLPAQLVGLVNGQMLAVAWLPMLAFEIPFGLWLIVRGVRSSTARPGETEPEPRQDSGRSSA